MNHFLELQISKFFKTRKLSDEQLKIIVHQIEVLKQKNPILGDYSSNIALKINKQFKVEPMELAEEIKDYLLSGNKYYQHITVTKPGFINFFLSAKFVVEELFNFLHSDYQIKFNLSPKKINYEFVSANPTGNLHVGHARNGVVGDVTVNVLKYLGHNVTREYYINDGGKQVENLASAVYYYFSKANNLPISYHREDIEYNGEEIQDLGRNLAKLAPKFLNLTENQALKELQDWAAKYFLKEIKLQLEMLKIAPFEIFTSEKILLKTKIEETLSALKASKYVYQKDGALWLKTIEFGDDKDRVLIKSDGSFTYMVADIANHIQKFNNGFNYLIDLWGADHHGYELRVKAALEILGYDSKAMEMNFISMVQIIANDQKLKMSKRAGTSITVKDIAKLIDLNIFRYFLISKTKEQNLDINLDLLQEKSLANPYYYLQYTNARIHQLLEKYFTKNSLTQEKFLKDLNQQDLIMISEQLGEQEKEKQLLLKMLEFSEQIYQSGKKREPNVLVNYGKELSIVFNSYYNSCKVISENKDQTLARITLIIALQNLYKTFFGLLGIAPQDKM